MAWPVKQSSPRKPVMNTPNPPSKLQIKLLGESTKHSKLWVYLIPTKPNTELFLKHPDYNKKKIGGNTLQKKLKDTFVAAGLHKAPGTSSHPSSKNTTPKSSRPSTPKSSRPSTPKSSRPSTPGPSNQSKKAPSSPNRSSKRNVKKQTRKWAWSRVVVLGTYY